jgi:hypothetical protein
MGTEDLIKKMTGSLNVKPEQLKPKVVKLEEEKSLIETIPLEPLQTVEQKIQEEVEKIKIEQIDVDKKYWNDEFHKVKKQFDEVKKNLDRVELKVTALITQIDVLTEQLKISKENPQVKISIWKRLINTCR